MVRCADVVDVRDGTHDSPKYVLEGYPLVTSKNIKENIIDFETVNYISQEDFEKINMRSKVDVGDILMPMIGTIGNPIVVNTEKQFAIKNVALFKTSKNDEIIGQYLYYVLKSSLVINQLENNKRGGTQAFVSLNNIRDLMIPKPKIEEQKKIVSILDKAQSLINKRKEQIQACDELVKSQFIEMFGSVEQTQYDVSSLSDICEFIKDGTHQTPIYTENKVDGYKFISSKDVTSGKIDWSNIKYIPKELHEELYAKIAPKRNDILLAKNGTTGICAVVETDDVFDIYVSVAILRPKQGYNSQYLWGAINSSDTKRQFDRSLKGIGVPNLHLGEIKKTRIIVPPIELQNEFAQFVQQVDKLKFGMEQSLKELQDNFDSLMQRVFKGELFKEK